jgi:hypothetical protein
MHQQGTQTLWPDKAISKDAPISPTLHGVLWGEQPLQRRLFGQRALKRLTPFLVKIE